MKKTLKKAIFTFAAVLAVSATVAMSAFAAVNVNSAFSEDNKTLTITIDGATEGKQLTVLVLKPGADTANPQPSDILYINQDAAGANGVLEYTITLDNPADAGKYLVRVGGEGDIEMVEKEISTNGATGNYIIGDVTNDGEIMSSDALQIIRYELGEISEFANGAVPVLVGDVNNDGEIMSSDALQIIRYELGEISEFARKSV